MGILGSGIERSRATVLPGTPELHIGPSGRGSPWKVDALLAVACGGLLMTQQDPAVLHVLPTWTFATAAADLIYSLQARRTLCLQDVWGERVVRRATYNPKP